MQLQELFLHYPSRLLWSGGCILLTLLLVSFFLLLPVADQPVFVMPSHQVARAEAPKTFFSICLENESDRFAWNPSAIEEDIQISLCPKRPKNENGPLVAEVRLIGSQQVQRVELPSQVYLFYNDRGHLSFQNEKGLFWLDLMIDQNQKLSATLAVTNQENEVERVSFSRSTETPVLQKAEEFSIGTPIRILCEGKFLGVDLVSQLETSLVKQRVAIGDGFFDIGDKDWICWKNGRWVKINDPDKAEGAIIAQIRSVTPNALEWNVWDAYYHRVAIPMQPQTSVFVKADEWINAVRVRSEKQISCAIEKQSVILRVGDWVLKENNRWRVLRKAEDRRGVIEGTKSGDLFVLEQIDAKQKAIKGKLFLSNRTQMIPIETMAMNNKQNKKRAMSKANHRVSPKEIK